MNQNSRQPKLQYLLTIVLLFFMFTMYAQKPSLVPSSKMMNTSSLDTCFSKETYVKLKGAIETSLNLYDLEVQRTTKLKEIIYNNNTIYLQQSNLLTLKEQMLTQKDSLVVKHELKIDKLQDKLDKSRRNHIYYLAGGIVTTLVTVLVISL